MDPSAPQQSPPSATAKAAFARFVERWRAQRRQAAQDALEVQRRAQMPPQVRRLNQRLDAMRYVRALSERYGFELEDDDASGESSMDVACDTLTEFVTDLVTRALQVAVSRGSTTLTQADFEAAQNGARRVNP